MRWPEIKIICHKVSTNVNTQMAKSKISPNFVVVRVFSSLYPCGAWEVFGSETCIFRLLHKSKWCNYKLQSAATSNLQ